ncbi:MAG TPA: alpha/beta hydrolase [Flavisolibacter sp.]|nr:alpha/beta hydrolase [Flavisolibacter sp.]
MTDILLLHGAIGSSSQLELLAQALEGSFKVHLIDFPGHGGSALPAAFDISFFAEHVRQYCADRHLKTVMIFGYSMGGYVAMYLAKTNPGLVGKIITLATKFHWDGPAAQKENAMLQPELILQKLPSFAKTLEERHAPQDWKEVLQKTAGMLTGLSEGKGLDPGDYKEIDIPCLLMLGDRDRMVSLQETVDVYKQLPQAQLAVLPKTPHPVEAADPSMLSFFIKSFLNG